MTNQIMKISIRTYNIELSYRILYKDVAKLDISAIHASDEVDPTRLSVIPQWRESLRSCLSDAFEPCDRLFITCEYYWWQVRINNIFPSLHNLNLSLEVGFLKYL